jgi:hypothetical protein
MMIQTAVKKASEWIEQSNLTVPELVANGRHELGAWYLKCEMIR